MEGRTCLIFLIMLDWLLSTFPLSNQYIKIGSSIVLHLLCLSMHCSVWCLPAYHALDNCKIISTVLFDSVHSFCFYLSPKGAWSDWDCFNLCHTKLLQGIKVTFTSLNLLSHHKTFITTQHSAWLIVEMVSGATSLMENIKLRMANRNKVYSSYGWKELYFVPMLFVI